MNDSSWQSQRVLVTGAGGFIASHLCETLVRRGATVRAFVRYNSRGEPGALSCVAPELLDEMEIVAGDLRDESAVREAMQHMDVVFHLGALIAVPYSYLHPAEVVQTNVMGTLNVLVAARDRGIRRLVHTSSSEVYGTALRVPIDETHPLQGQSPYSASKISADKLAESFYRSFDVPVVTLRPFNTYGPRQSRRAVIPTIISQVLVDNVLRLGNLDASRDLTFVSDTVDGFLQVAEKPGILGETMNLGTGSEIRVRDLAREIFSLVGRSIPIEIDKARLRPENSEVQRLVCDSRRARQVLGWEPAVTLRDGLQKTIEWIRQQPQNHRSRMYQV
jgi:dTDP-glucose 4,6-dehydratase